MRNRNIWKIKGTIFQTFIPWPGRRLMLEWGKSERYGFELTADFGYGWGVVLMVWHYYLAVDWWRVDLWDNERE